MPCAVINIIKEAMAKRVKAIVKGCATSSPFLVAVDAEDHSNVNNSPVTIQRNDILLFFKLFSINDYLNILSCLLTGS